MSKSNFLARSKSKETTVVVDMDVETGAFTLRVDRFGRTAHSFTLGKENRTEDDTRE